MSATAEAPPARSGVLTSLTGIRGIAASAVFVNHVGHWVAATPLRDAWYAVTYVGICGVILFFVLSGYLLAQPASLRGGVRGFWHRRLARIAPLYWLSLLVAWGFGQYLDAGHPNQRPLNVLTNALLVQSWGASGTESSLNLPAWSLSVELLFYALLPLTLPWARRVFARHPAAALAALLVLTQAGALLVRLGVTTTALPPVYLPVFYLGVYAAVVRLRVPSPAVATALALGAVAGSVPFEYFGVVAPAFMVLVAAYAAADLSGTGAPLGSRPWQLLGLWSYGFFLWHVPVGMVMLGVLDVVPRTTGLGLALSAAQLVAAWVVAAAAYHWFEEPARKWVLRQRRPVSAR